MDKCPKCGANTAFCDNVGKKFICGSTLLSNGKFFFHPICAEIISSELAAIKARHERLVEAAKKLLKNAIRSYDEWGATGDMECDSEDFDNLKKALESEANHD